IDDGERELATRMVKPQIAVIRAIHVSLRTTRRSEREVHKEMPNPERTIARLDEQKRLIHTALMATTDPAEALRLHNEVSELTTKLAEAESRWCMLRDEAGVID